MSSKEKKVNIKLKDLFMIFLPSIALLSFLCVPSIIYEFLIQLNLSSILSQVFADFIYLVVILVLFRKSLLKEFLTYKKHFKSNFKVGLKAWATGIAIMIGSNIVINLFVFNGSVAGNEEAIRELLKIYPVYVFLASVIFAPIAEEITFRKLLKESVKTKWLFIITSGFAFGFLHALTDISNLLNFLYIIPYGVLGCAFAYMNYETDSVFTSITFHFLHNFLTMMLLLSVAGIVM